MTLLNPNEDKATLHTQWSPSVRFEIPHEGIGHEYRGRLTELFKRFLGQLSPKGSNVHALRNQNPSPPHESEALECFHIDETYHRDGFMITWYDGKHSLTEQGLRMHDHLHKSQTVELIYMVAERFERFLQDQEINYKRFGLQNGSEQETEQKTLW
ncbi:MAG: hypothetical protein V4509_02900 [Patescibacteria group bacterium]